MSILWDCVLLLIAGWLISGVKENALIIPPASDVFSPHHPLSFGAAVLMFCGDLLFVPSGINHHPFENLRRKASLPRLETTRLGGRPQKFCLLWAKSFAGCAFHRLKVWRRLWLSLPRRGTHTYGVRHRDNNNGQGTSCNDEERGQRTALPPHIPAAFAGDAGSAGHGATGGGATVPVAAKPGFCAVRDEARRGGDSLLALFTDSPPRQGRREKANSRGEQQN